MLIRLSLTQSNQTKPTSTHKFPQFIQLGIKITYNVNVKEQMKGKRRSHTDKTSADVF